MVDAHFDFIWRTLRRHGVGEAGCDDAAQQVFIVAARRLDDIEDGSERAFLFGTALRVAADVRKARSRRHEDLLGPRDDLAALGASDPSPEELADRKRACELLETLLGQLPEELASVFSLFELEGLTTVEIAALAGIPVGTAASRLRRAREEFERAVQRYEARSAFRAGVT